MFHLQALAYTQQYMTNNLTYFREISMLNLSAPWIVAHVLVGTLLPAVNVSAKGYFERPLHRSVERGDAISNLSAHYTHHWSWSLIILINSTVTRIVGLKLTLSKECS